MVAFGWIQTRTIINLDSENLRTVLDRVNDDPNLRNKNKITQTCPHCWSGNYNEANKMNTPSTMRLKKYSKIQDPCLHPFVQVSHGKFQHSISFQGFFGANIYIYIFKKHIYIYLHIWFLVCGSNSGCLGDIPKQIRCGPPWFAKDAERIIWSRSSCGHCGLFCARNDAGRPGLVRSVTCLMMWGWRYWHQVFFWEDECLSMVASL